MQFELAILFVIAALVVSDGSSSTCCAGRSLTDTPQKDLARRAGVSVSMSTEYPGNLGYSFPGSRAVDNMYIPPVGPSHAPDLSSIAHTQNERSPWLQIDLRQRRCIKGVKIWNRFYGSQSRFTNAVITVSENGFGNDSTSTRCAYSAGMQPAVRFHQCPNVMCGQYVRVTALNSNNVLDLYEIEVHGW